MEEYSLLAVTLEGLEDVLAGELTKMGASSVTPLRRAVSFRGDKELLYKANLYSRCALRILKEIGRYPVHSDQDLDDIMQGM